MNHPSRRMRRMAVTVALALLAGCTGGHKDTGPQGGPGRSVGPGTWGPDGKLAVSLREGTARAAGGPGAARVVTGTDLGTDQVASILDRLPAWADDAAPAPGFRWPAESLPVPRSGVTTQVPFPAGEASSPVPTTSGPLEVTRVQPDGDVPIAPFVAVSFNQPMVAVATIEQLATGDAPATITPAIAGHWQWVGTQTLRFDADDPDFDRLPMATEYTVTVPAGTRSASGAVLGQARSFTFRTPAPNVTAIQPDTSWPLGRRPVFLAAFDQRVDPAEVLAHVLLSVDGTRYPVRLATDTEVAADDTVTTSALGAGRWVAFVPGRDLPADAGVTVAIEAGTPSAEGPLTSPHTVTHHWRTYAPLVVTASGCGGEPCPPGVGFGIELSNDVDLTAFDPSAISVEPAIRGFGITAFGRMLGVSGSTKAHATYTVTLPASLTDVFGQSLGRATPVKVTIGGADTVLESFSSLFTTLDPMAATPALTVGSVNQGTLRVRLFAVTQQDWDAYLRFALDVIQSQPGQPLPPPPWPAATDRIVTVAGAPDERVETSVDLSGILGADGTGSVVALVEPGVPPTDVEAAWMRHPTISWFQGTRLGIDAFTDGTDLTVWVTDLRTGSPMAGATVATLQGDRSVVTGTDGVGHLDLAAGAIDVLVASHQGDVALLPHGTWGPGSAWVATTGPDQARWYVVDDRHTYRPGEAVSVKGFLRRYEAAGDARLHSVGEGAVHYLVADAAGVAIADGSVTPSALGGFAFTVALPAGTNQGPATITFEADAFGRGPATAATHHFQVEEFRRPEFEVTTRVEGDEPVVSALPATVTLDASYYAGGPLASAPVTWSVTMGDASYSPPGWDQWTFGRWAPWWGPVTIDAGRSPMFDDSPDAVKSFVGATDATGSHYLQIDFTGIAGVKPDLPVRVTAQGAVLDINRQMIASSTDLLVHPADYYVGLRTTRTFVAEGDPLDVDAVVTSIDGTAVAGRPVRVTAARMQWQYRKGAWSEVAVDTESCDRTSGTDPVRCTFEMAVGGTYTITATVEDDRGARSRTELTRWVSGGPVRPDRGVWAEQLTLVPDRSDYAPGETALVLVHAPFSSGHGIVLTGRGGSGPVVNFDLADGSAVVPIPLTDDDVPGVVLTFDVAGTAPRTGDDGRPLAGAPARPAYATGALTVPVSTASRTLTVTATPAHRVLAPGASTTVELTVTGPDGKPVGGAEVAVAVVDEAVLALGPYSWPDPVALMYQVAPGISDAAHGRASIVLADPVALVDRGGTYDGRATGGAATTAAGATTTGGNAVARAMPGAPQEVDAPAGEGEGGGGDGAIDVRTNFDALALFAPSVLTGADGRAAVPVTLPDNLTRYRVMVVAASGDEHFGSTASTITARRPLMVRPAAPRFANFGDRFELPVVVQNQTDRAMTVDVVLQASNLTLGGAPGRRVEVAANDRVEVRFGVGAAAAGTARLRVAAVSATASDAATVELPVYTPVTTEAFATYGVIDQGASAQPVLAPTGVVPQFGGLDITTSSTALAGLTNAVITILECPYASADMRAARIMSIVALEGVLSAFGAAGLPDRSALDDVVAGDVAAIAALQTPEGGFAHWHPGRPSDPWVTAYAAHALVVAEAAGFAVPGPTLGIALAYLGQVDTFIPATYGPEERDATKAYALAVLAAAGQPDAARAEDLWHQRSEALGLDAMAWLWPLVEDDSIRDEIARRIDNRAVEEAGAVTFTSSYDDGAYVILHSDRRVDAVVLGALMSERPASDLIPKAVTGLLAHRRGDAWDSSQESAVVLAALARYFTTYEPEAPDFVARVWLGDRYAGDEAFSGRSVGRQQVTIPTAELQATGDTTVVVAKEGDGRLYYRIGLRYAPSDLRAAAIDRGFVVARTYEAVDDPSDVRLDEDGVWHVKAGAAVRVRLTMVAQGQRTHVALVDPLPAGLEVVNAALATSPALAPPGQPGLAPQGGWTRPWPWYPTWWEHQNLRDDRVEAFAALLPAGAYDYSYVTRATTPGTFVAPPTRAEQVYAPEVFGRGASTTVVVEAA